MRITSSLLMAAMLLLTSGCGGGDATSTDTPTPAGVAVNIATFKSIYHGTATTGSQASFSLAGSDLQGNAWTGSYTVTSDGATTFETQNVTASHCLLNIQKTNYSPTNLLTTRYYLSPGEATYKTIDYSGRILVTIAEVPLPDIPRVGEEGTGTTSNSDGTTSTITWELDPDVNGNSILSFITVTKAADNSIVAEESDSFYLDPSGNAFKMIVIVTTSGTTVTLSGNKI